jgi:hypothetical protein
MFHFARRLASPATSAENEVVLRQLRLRHRQAAQSHQCAEYKLADAEVDTLLDSVYTENRDYSRDSDYHCTVCQKQIVYADEGAALHTSAVLPMRFVCHVQELLSICPTCQLTPKGRDVQQLLQGMRVPPDRGMLERSQQPDLHEHQNWPTVRFVGTRELETNCLPPDRRWMQKLVRFPRVSLGLNLLIEVGVPLLVGLAIGRATCRRATTT